MSDHHGRGASEKSPSAQFNLSSNGQKSNDCDVHSDNRSRSRSINSLAQFADHNRREKSESL